ncbi:MAG: cation transporter [Oscillospiraceae bacterium]|nr:cation transporter [Oscillospiraceae bacterium]
MTNFLMRLAVGEDADLTQTGTRAAVGRLSGVVGIGCNLLLAVGKLIAGVLASSVSITADALNNLSDAASSIVTLVGFKLAEKPADAEHPYGHARSEYLSGLAVAVLIIVIGFELAKSSVEKILNPEAVEITVVTVIVLLASIAVKLWMYLFNGKLGKLIDSSALAAAAADSRNDCIATGAVLVAAAIEYATSWKVDGWMGLGVALFVLVSGWNLARETVSPLMGEGADPALRQRIVDYIEASPKVLGYHDLMVHDYGPGQRFASIHVEMDCREDPLLCHEIIDDIERECLESHGIHLVIHYDPVETDDPKLKRMRTLVLSILRMKDSRLSIHDFRMAPGTCGTALSFDVALPADLLGQEEQIRSALTTALNDLGEGNYETLITFDPEELH